jgi:uncharacterized heparinase superfamily protein
MSELAWLSPPDPSTIDALCQNAFTFHHHTVQFGSSVDWRVSNVSALWRYNLHYFGWGHTLALAHLRVNRDDARARFLQLVDDWIKQNPRGSSPGWDPFVVATRLMNWAQTFSVFGEVPSHVLQSYAIQTDWLLHHLEKDVRANHLLKNAQALVIAGAVLGGRCGDAATQCGTALLAQELDEQILDDGGHYERSLMYHCQVLDDNLHVHAALENPPHKLTAAIVKMAEFLARMIYPDGGIPQFGDASLDLETPPDVLLRCARKRLPEIDVRQPTGSRAEESSGFYVLELPTGEARMTVKAGMPGPAYQLGHAHCDMLSYEFTAGTDRLIVDSGVYGYEDDKWRAYCRNTSAHNTVQIRRLEQMECWDRFRVGRRYTPTVHAWREYAGGQLLHASHDGFAPYRHERIVYLSPERFWLVADQITGIGNCSVNSFVHFHPNLEYPDHCDPIKLKGVDWCIAHFGFDDCENIRGSEDPLQGWYFPSFGIAKPSTCLRFHRRGRCPVLCGYAMFNGNESRVSPESLTRAALRKLAQELFDVGA